MGGGDIVPYISEQRQNVWKGENIDIWKGRDKDIWEVEI